MLSQKYRFHGYGSLNFLYKKGKSTRSSLATLRYIKNPYRKNCRFSVVISKKVIKSAVLRNRLRRRIYEIIRLELPTLKDSYDVAIIIFSRETYFLDHKKLNELIKSLLSQSDIYK